MALAKLASFHKKELPASPCCTPNLRQTARMSTRRCWALHSIPLAWTRPSVQLHKPAKKCRWSYCQAPWSSGTFQHLLVQQCTVSRQGLFPPYLATKVIFATTAWNRTHSSHWSYVRIPSPIDHLNLPAVCCYPEFLITLSAHHQHFPMIR